MNGKAEGDTKAKRACKKIFKWERCEMREEEECIE